MKIYYTNGPDRITVGTIAMQRDVPVEVPDDIGRSLIFKPMFQAFLEPGPLPDPSEQPKINSKGD